MVAKWVRMKTSDRTVAAGSVTPPSPNLIRRHSQQPGSERPVVKVDLLSLPPRLQEDDAHQLLCKIPTPRCSVDKVAYLVRVAFKERGEGRLDPSGGCFPKLFIDRRISSHR
jgi:hypothetical protein